MVSGVIPARASVVAVTRTRLVVSPAQTGLGPAPVEGELSFGYWVMNERPCKLFIITLTLPYRTHVTISSRFTRSLVNVLMGASGSG